MQEGVGSTTFELGPCQATQAGPQPRDKPNRPLSCFLNRLDLCAQKMCAQDKVVGTRDAHPRSYSAEDGGVIDVYKFRCWAYAEEPKVKIEKRR